MPAKNSAKQYVENSFYHLYNRGVEKRIIFMDQQDYSVFISYLKEYLLFRDDKKLLSRLADPNISWRERDRIIKKLHINNFVDEIMLIAFGLVPNHFHLLVKQKTSNSIDRFMNSLGTRYTMYFNRKYKRVGSLYQGVYKAVLIETEEQLLNLTRYIHKQAQVQHSSYFDYIGKTKNSWIRSDEILKYFSQKNPHLSYKSFFEKYISSKSISKLTLE